MKNAWTDVQVASHVSLADYASVMSLTTAVDRLRAEALLLVPQLRDRTVWMLSSTAVGGGVAEMMPQVVALLRELGVQTRWLVMHSTEPRFFRVTKRLHNLVHGHGEPGLGADDRALYDAVSRDCAESLRGRVSVGDIVVVHDPQPLGVGALIRHALATPLVWRCHIGADQENAATRDAWSFLGPYAAACDHALFSAHEYIRDFLAGRSSVMRPTIDPLSHKNRELPPSKLVGILCNAGLLTSTHPLLAPPFDAPALRLRSDGVFGPATKEEDIGLLFRPVVTQVSRWDRLKGFLPLLDAFCAIKRRAREGGKGREDRRLEIVRLVLAGPDPRSIPDDPEAAEVLSELTSRYRSLPPALQRDVAVVALPMESRKHNALMVNCLQRCSLVVAQNSLAEGFGLSATEAMWKQIPVLASRACGLRQQVRDGLDGRLVSDPTDVRAIVDTLAGMLADSRGRAAWGRNGQRRVFEEFLIFSQLRQWIATLAALVPHR